PNDNGPLSVVSCSRSPTEGYGYVDPEPLHPDGATGGVGPACLLTSHGGGRWRLDGPELDGRFTSGSRRLAETRHGLHPAVYAGGSQPVRDLRPEAGHRDRRTDPGD